MASRFTRFFHIGSVQLYRPLRLAFIPTVCSNAITDDLIEFTGVNHPLNRFNVYEQLFQANDGTARSDWARQLRLSKLAATSALMSDLVPERQVAHAVSEPLTVLHGDALEDEMAQLIRHAGFIHIA